LFPSCGVVVLLASVTPSWCGGRSVGESDDCDAGEGGAGRQGLALPRPLLAALVALILAISPLISISTWARPWRALSAWSSLALASRAPQHVAGVVRSVRFCQGSRGTWQIGIRAPAAVANRARGVTWVLEGHQAQPRYAVSRPAAEDQPPTLPRWLSRAEFQVSHRSRRPRRSLAHEARFSLPPRAHPRIPRMASLEMPPR